MSRNVPASAGRRGGAAAALSLFLAPLAPAQGRPLVHEAVVRAPVDQVWRAWTDPVEMVRWMGVAKAEIDLRLGGTWRTTYRPDEDLGGPSTIVHEILSLEPGRMLSTRCRKVPEGSGLDLFEATWLVVRLEPLAPSRTRVVVSVLGWGEGGDWERVRGHFEEGNAWTLRRLVERFEEDGALAPSDDPEYRSYLAHVAAAEASLRLGDAGAARRWLEGAPEDLRGWEWRRIDAESDRSLLAFDAHPEGVTAVAYSPDGRLLATGSVDRTIKIWDAGSRTLRRTLEGHEREVHSLAWSPDGALLASSAGDATARVWRVADGACATVFANHTYPVSTVRFSPDGKRVASTSYHRPEGGEIRIWDASSGEESALLREGYAPITCAAWRPDGAGLWSGSWTGTLQMWDLDRPGEPRTFPLGSEDDYRAANALALSPDGGAVAVGGKDDLVHVFDAATGEKIRDLAGHDAWVEALAYSPDGSLLASASVDRSIAVWSAGTNARLGRLLGHRSGVRALSFAPDGGVLASGSDDGTVRLWDVRAMRRPIDRFEFEAGDGNTAYYACESPDGRLLAVAFHGGRVRLLSTADGSEVRALESEKWVNWLDFTADGKRLLAAGGAGLAVWDPSSGERRLAIDATTGVECAVFSPDGARIASAARDKTARIFDAATGEELLSLPHAETVRSVAFSPDGVLLATASYKDPVVRLFDSRSGEVRLALDGHGIGADAVAFLPDGKRLASTASDGFLRLWRASDGALLGARRVHDGSILSLAVHPDGTRIATGGDDYAVVLWDAATLEPVSRTVDREAIYALGFSPDGRRLAVVPLANRVHFCDTVPLRERLTAR